MQKVVCKQSLMFDDGMKRRGDVITLQNSEAKKLVDSGVVEMIGDTDDEPAESKTKENSVTFSDKEGKKLYDSGTTEKHIADDKAKPSAVKEAGKANVTEVKKEKAPKEK